MGFLGLPCLRVKQQSPAGKETNFYMLLLGVESLFGNKPIEEQKDQAFHPTGQGQ
jgi:hypothetical protein